MLSLGACNRLNGAVVLLPRIVPQLHDTRWASTRAFGDKRSWSVATIVDLLHRFAATERVTLVRLSVCLPVCLPTCMPACPPACLPVLMTLSWGTPVGMFVCLSMGRCRALRSTPSFPTRPGCTTCTNPIMTRWLADDRWTDRLVHGSLLRVNLGECKSDFAAIIGRYRCTQRYVQAALFMRMAISRKLALPALALIPYGQVPLPLAAC
jgi:hypothetical protein